MKRRIAAWACVALALLAGASGAAQKKDDSGNVNDRGDLASAKPIKGKDGKTVNNMTARECGLLGGQVTQVTAGNCGSRQACFVKLADGSTGGACITQ